MKGFIRNSFTNLRTPITLLFITFLAFSCTDSTTSELFESIDFTQAINEYNRLIPEGDPKHKAIIIPGDIRVEKYKDEESQDWKLVLYVTGKDVFRKYQFQYEMIKGEIDIPETIANGRTVFLGDNLIVQDFQNRKNYHFIIEGSDNRVPALEPTMHGIGILSVIFNDKESLVSTSGVCSCSCRHCGICDFNCGSYTASCSCGGDSQSISCRDCYNAECTKCDDPKE